MPSSSGIKTVDEKIVELDDAPNGNPSPAPRSLTATPTADQKLAWGPNIEYHFDYLGRGQCKNHLKYLYSYTKRVDGNGLTGCGLWFGFFEFSSPRNEAPYQHDFFAIFTQWI